MMDWSNEPYVKVYTRETDDDIALSWEARALWDALMKRFDRSGIIATKRGVRGIAGTARIPFDVVERALPELLSDGRLREMDGGYIAPNFLAAQDARKSDKLRQKESRETRRSRNLDGSVTKSDETSRAVTPSHTPSQDVTLCSADPDPDPLLSEASRPRAIPPSTVQAPVLVPVPLPDDAVPFGTDPRDRGKLAEVTWARLSQTRVTLAAELAIDGILPLPAAGPVHHTAAFRDLLARIREEGEIAPKVCDRVLETLVAQARETRSIEWLSEKAFTEGGWRTARESIPGWRRPERAVGTGSGPRPRLIPVARPRLAEGS